MKLLSLLSAVLFLSFSFQAVAEELPAEAQQMLNDLGVPAVQQKNSGKKIRCLHGGSKTITVSLLGDATVFSGDYNFCREVGSTRDGYYEVIVKHGEVVGRSAKRSPNGDLFDAAQAGDVKKAKKSISKKADVNYTETLKTTDGGVIHEWTPLMSAAMTGNVNMVKLLLKSGALVNYLNSQAISALWLAAGKGNPEIVKLLIQNGAYVNNRNIDELTPLMNAAMEGHYKAAKLLVDAKADLNLVHKDGDSALMFALASRRSDVAKLLIDSGANINIQNKFGVSPLLIAVAEGNEEMVRILVDRKADTTVKTDAGKTALDIATAKKNENIIKMLK